MSVRVVSYMAKNIFEFVQRSKVYVLKLLSGSSHEQQHGVYHFHASLLRNLYCFWKSSLNVWNFEKRLADVSYPMS